MAAFSIVFALLMLGMALAASVLVGWACGNVWAGLGFAGFLVGLFKLSASEEVPPSCTCYPHGRNVFQRLTARRRCAACGE